MPRQTRRVNVVYLRFTRLKSCFGQARWVMYVILMLLLSVSENGVGK